MPKVSYYAPSINVLLLTTPLLLAGYPARPQTEGRARLGGSIDMGEGRGECLVM